MLAVDEAVKRAYQARSDYQAAAADVNGHRRLVGVSGMFALGLTHVPKVWGAAGALASFHGGACPAIG